MSTSLAVFLLLVAPTDAGDDIVRGIVENGQKKVGVIPTVINRRGDREATIGSLGPRGKVMANAVYEKLISASQSGRYKGRYKVVPERIMRGALKSRSLDDLANPRKLQELADDVGGADGFVITTIDEDESVFDVDSVDVEGDEEEDEDGKTTKKKSKKTLVQNGSIETIDPSDGVVTDKTDISDELTLSKAAYQGESWELRRWNGDELENYEKAIELEGDDAFGRGSGWERAQYVKLSIDLEHPYEDTTFPYPIAIKVDGEIREPRVIGDKCVVELNAGEDYSVIVKNDGDQDVYAALFIDGLNSINQELVEPEQLATKLHWRLQKGIGDREIRGWYKIDYNDKKTDMWSYKKFTVVDRAESVAASQGFEDNIGMITAIFYTVGMKNIDEPEEAPTRSLANAIVGTGEGEEVEQEVGLIKGAKRGLMLAAWTFYYRTKEQIEEIESGDSEEWFFEDENFVSFNDEDKKEDDDSKDEDDEKEEKEEDDDGEELEIIDFD